VLTKEDITIGNKIVFKTRTVLNVVIVSVLCLFFIAGIKLLLDQHRNHLEEGLELRSEFVLEAIAIESKLDLLLLDSLSLGLRTFDYFKRDSSISGMSFYGENGALIIGSIKSELPYNFAHIHFLKRDKDLITTIKVNDELAHVIGYISISYTYASLNKMVSNLAVKLVVLSFLFIVIIGLVLMRLVRLIQRVTEREARNKSDLELEKNNSRMQKSFLANMSHELRTPLNAIIGFSKMIESPSIGKENRSNLGYLMEASYTMLFLINDILDFSKIESGEMELESEDFDVSKLTRGVCHSLMPKISDKVYFDAKVAIEEHQFVYGDCHRVKQVLSNVINNAVKYTVEGVIRVTADCRREGDVILFRCVVSDTGIGISEEALSEIFTPFKQVHSRVEMTSEIIGTGLGLAIVKSLTELMEGKIWCERD